MPFKKGQSGNKDGRPKGSKNKDTAFRAAIKEGLPIETVLAELWKIEKPSEKMSAMLKLLEFAHPKLKAIEHSGDVGGQNFIVIDSTKLDAKRNNK